MKLLARGTFTGNGRDVIVPIPLASDIVIIRPGGKRENRHDRKRSMKIARELWGYYKKLKEKTQ